MSNASGLVLDIDFAEKSGSVAGDASRYGNDGALAGCKWVEHGLEFNGSSDYVNCGNDPSLEPTDAITISVWVKPNTLTGRQQIICKNTPILLALDGNIVGTETGLYTTDGWKWITGTKTFVVGEWSCIVLTYDKENIKLYINGEFDNYTASTFDMVSNQHLLLIGGWSAGTVPTAYQFHGSIDQPRIYNRALNASEIKAYYDETKHRYK